LYVCALVGVLIKYQIMLDRTLQSLPVAVTWEDQMATESVAAP